MSPGRLILLLLLLLFVVVVVMVVDAVFIVDDVVVIANAVHVALLLRFLLPMLSLTLPYWPSLLAFQLSQRCVVSFLSLLNILASNTFSHACFFCCNVC